MASDPAPGPSTPPAQRKAAIFATWAKGAAPLIASIGAVVLGLINIYKKPPPETVAMQSYKELSAQVERISAATLTNHDDNVNLRGWVAGRLGDGISGIAVASSTVAAPAASVSIRVPISRPLITTKNAGPSRPLAYAPADASPASSGALMALLLPDDNLKALPPVSPRPVQYKAKPIEQVQSEAAKAP